jgi:hypothetical protein
MACGGCCNAVQYWLCTLCCGCLSPLTVVSRSVSRGGGNPSLVVPKSESSSIRIAIPLAGRLPKFAIVIPNRNRLLSLVALSVRHLASCSHHSLRMYLAPPPPLVVIIISRNTCTSRRRSSSLASRLISRTTLVYLANRRCRLLLSSRMYTKFRHPLRYHVLYSCSICLLGKIGGSFF